jgi:hypothetical protein
MINLLDRLLSNINRDLFPRRRFIQAGGIPRKLSARTTYTLLLLVALNGLAYGQATSGSSGVSFRILDQHQLPQFDSLVVKGGI